MPTKIKPLKLSPIDESPATGGGGKKETTIERLPALPHRPEGDVDVMRRAHSLASTRSPFSDDGIDMPSIDVLELDDPARMSPNAIVAELRYYGMQVSQVGLDDRSTLERALVEARRQNPDKGGGDGGGRDQQTSFADESRPSRNAPQHYETPVTTAGTNAHPTHIPLLPGNRIPPQIINVIRTSADPTMRVISLDNKHIGDDECIKLCRAMERNTTVTSLSLRNCRITDAGASRGLAVMLKANGTLSELRLDDNRIGTEGAASLGTALIINETLAALTLSGNSTLGDAGVSYLIGALEHNVAIRTLDVTNVGRDANAKGRARQIDEMLLDRQFDSTFEPLLDRLVDDDYHVTGIDLSGQRIGDVGAMRLADALADNTHVRQLWLRGCNVGDDGARALASCLEQNMSIVDLYLANNRIGDDGLIAISDALASSNSTLVSFELDGNDVGVVGLRAFIRAIETNTSVLTASFEDNPKLSKDSSSPQMVSDLLAKLREKLDGMNRAAFVVDPASTTSQADDNNAGVVDLSVCSSYMPSTYRRAGMDSQVGGRASYVQPQSGNRTASSSSKMGLRATVGGGRGAAPPPPLPYPRHPLQVQRPSSSPRQRHTPDPEEASRRDASLPSSRPASTPPTSTVGSSSRWQEQIRPPSIPKPVRSNPERWMASSQGRREIPPAPTQLPPPPPQSIEYERQRAPTPNNARALQTIVERNEGTSSEGVPSQVRRDNKRSRSRGSKSPRSRSKEKKEDQSRTAKSTITAHVVPKAPSHVKTQSKATAVVTPRVSTRAPHGHYRTLTSSLGNPPNT